MQQNKESTKIVKPINQKKMDRYIIISNHTVEECNRAIKFFKEYHTGYLTHFEWGCHDNDHNAYAIIEANNHSEAIMAVPPLFRNKTKAIKLTTFNISQNIDTMHFYDK
ncbi:MAG: hypothetical protein A2046_13830 [Bacteroidetes bacterium GWA2_30_7]|nr:MAG: hypothetical protein A2046_13830 [Bacteroidetes bacterium GWA2_30_7]